MADVTKSGQGLIYIGSLSPSLPLSTVLRIAHSPGHEDTSRVLRVLVELYYARDIGRQILHLRAQMLLQNRAT